MLHLGSRNKSFVITRFTESHSETVETFDEIECGD